MSGLSIADKWMWMIAKSEKLRSDQEGDEEGSYFVVGVFFLPGRFVVE